MAISLSPEEKVLRQGAERASNQGNQQLMETYSTQLDKRLTDRGAFQTSPRQNIEPSVSAEQLANPPQTVKPPVPAVSTNDGSRTQGLIDNVATNTQGFITAQSEEAAKAKELASLLGNQTFDGQGQRTQLGEQFGLPQNLSRLTDIQTQLARANTASGITKTQIQGAAGQTLGQAGREITQEDRENAVRTAGLAAEAAVLQGSIETASTLVNQAMSDYYNDRQLQNANMIQQLNYFSGIADEQTSQLLEQEKRVYEADQAEIARVLATVDAALTSGAATAEDMRQLTDPRLTDEQRLQVAQGVVSRGAGELRNLEIEQLKAQTASANRANRPTPAAEKLRPTSIIEQDGKNLLVDTQTGEIISEFGADVDTSEIRAAQDVEFVNTVDSLKTDRGLSKAVGANALARFTPFKIDVMSGDVKDFTASVDQLTKGLTLDTLIQAKEQGATFGALAIPEMELLADSATKINNWRTTETDENGNTTTLYYDASEADFKEELDKISNFKKLDAVLRGTDPASVGVMVMEDGTYWAQNSDGSYTQLR